MYNRRFPSLRTPASGKRLNSYPNHDSNHSRKIITSYDNFSAMIAFIFISCNLKPFPVTGMDDGERRFDI